MLRIEVRDSKSDRWNPAFMAVAGTNLTPERASTFETPEVAFEKCAQLAKLRPEARYRIVETTAGVVIWGPGETIDRETGAVFLNGGPADPVEAQFDVEMCRVEILAQIIASQEEFIAGLAELRGAIDYIKSVHPGGCARALRLLEAADNAAQETLTNLRALAKPG